MLRPALALALCVTACGPEPGAALPVSGIYDVQTETLENTCRTVSDEDWAYKDIVAVDDDSITVGFSHYVSGLRVDCDGCENVAGFERVPFGLDEHGRYVFADSRAEWSEVEGCSRRRSVELEVLDEQTLRGHITQEWANTGDGCPHAPVAGCTFVREYTFTLDEACDDCTLTPPSPSDER